MAPVQKFIIWMVIKDKYLYELYLYSYCMLTKISFRFTKGNVDLEAVDFYTIHDTYELSFY